MNLEQTYNDILKISKEIYDVYNIITNLKIDNIVDKNMMYKLKYLVSKEDDLYNKIENYVDCHIINNQLKNNITDNFNIHKKLIFSRIYNRSCAKAYSFDDFKYVRCYYNGEISIPNFCYFEEIDKIISGYNSLDTKVVTDNFLDYKNQKIGVCGRLGTAKTIFEEVKSEIYLKTLILINYYIENSKAPTKELLIKEFFQNLYLNHICEYNFIQNDFKLNFNLKQPINKNNLLLYQAYKEEYSSLSVKRIIDELKNNNFKLNEASYIIYFSLLQICLKNLDKENLDIIESSIINEMDINNINVIGKIIKEIDDVQKSKVKKI